MPPRIPPPKPGALWRSILEWGVVIYFLGIPLFYLIIVFTPLDVDLAHHPNIRQFITQFHITLTAIVTAMAGLNSWDKRK